MLDQQPHPDQDLARLKEPWPEILFRLDRALRRLYISPSGEPVTGLASSQFLGKTGRELGLSVEACDLFELTCHEVFATGQPQQLEFVDRGPRYRTCLVPQRARDGCGRASACRPFAGASGRP